MTFLADELHGWAVGEGGTILATQDGGASWSPQASGTGVSLKSIAFAADGVLGWAVGRGGTILATRDGGASWTQQASVTGKALESIAFAADGTRGWAVSGGLGGTILATRDGGASWTQQASVTGEPLESIAFTADGALGWAVGGALGGTILATRDGGASWSPQASGTGELLESVAFAADGALGWAVGSSGTIVATRNGGASWSAQESGTGVLLNSVAFAADGVRGWAVGGGGTILATRDGGASWSPQASGTGHFFESITFAADGARGWAVGWDGMIVATRDGGASWSRQASGTWESLYSVAFAADGARGWAVGGSGTILATRDGGASWSRQASGTEASLQCISFAADGARGWAVGDGGTIVVTQDGGTSWSPQTSGTVWALHSVAFAADGARGWAVGPSGTIVATRDGGASWSRQASGTGQLLKSITVAADGVRGWAVGWGGTIVATRDGGASWSRQASGTAESLNSVAFAADGARGWAVGPSGTIMSTRDGGASWTPQASGTEAWTECIAFATDGARGWVAGGGWTFLATRDGGATWSAPFYRRYPAPWSALATALLLFGAIAVVRRKPRRLRSPEPSVADLLASDRPLERGDRDVLGFATRASGVVRFLANEKTDPPLTLAVTGEWGSGKSSLMNLIRDGLGEYGFRTIWFNAWHHQTDEHLLAALNEALKRGGTPAWWTLEGLGFRARLLFRRGWRNWVPVALLVIALGAFAGFLAGGERYARALGLEQPADWPRSGKALVLLVTAAATLLPLVRGLATFASSASPLWSQIFGRLRLDAGGVSSGLRQRFAEHFRDVTEALGPRRLVLFIDDLDRCQPENVVRVLELVSFLVSSGKCYVVLGIAPEWVASAVGLGFKDVADEWAALQGSDAEGTVSGANEDVKRADAAAERRRFALKYLSKLVNIEIPVAPLSEQQAKGLLATLAGEDGAERRADERATTMPAARWLRRLAPFAPLGFFLGLGALAVLVPPELLDLVPPAPTRSEEVARDPFASLDLPWGPSGAPEKPADESETPSDLPGREEALEPSGPVYTPGATHELPIWPALLSVVLLLVWGVHELARVRLPLERDSADFRQALERWAPVVYRANPSPRSVKRFLNRVRYMAMCQRPPLERTTWWQRITALFRFRRPAARAPSTLPGAIPEPELVALAALHHAFPDDIETDELWKGPESFLAKRKTALAGAASNGLDQLHRHRAAFEVLSDGISIRV